MAAIQDKGIFNTFPSLQNVPLDTTTLGNFSDKVLTFYKERGILFLLESNTLYLVSIKEDLVLRFFNFFFKLNLLGQHRLISLYSFQVYNFIILHHLYIPSCAHHPKFSLLLSPYIFVIAIYFEPLYPLHHPPLELISPPKCQFISIPNEKLFSKLILKAKFTLSVDGFLHSLLL